MFKNSLIALLALPLSTTLLAAKPAPKQITLPKPKIANSMALNQTLLKRRSHRNFKTKPLTLKQISTLLWAGQGITDSKHKFRTAPSAGAIYPVTLYLVKKDGTWETTAGSNQIKQIKDGDLRKQVAQAALSQNFIAKAPLIIVFAVDYTKLAKKYGYQSKPYANIEVGHITQNIMLEAVSLGLATVPIGGVRSNVIHQMLNIPGNQFPIYLLVVGHKA